MRWMWLVMLGLAGCHDTDCNDLEQQIRAALATPGTCETEADCTIIGGQIGVSSCDCVPSIVDCEGLPTAKNAPGLSHAFDLLDDYASASCANKNITCDCAPRGPMDCVNHVCTAAEQSCLPESTDAGVD
jgi:hypothetical protein